MVDRVEGARMAREHVERLPLEIPAHTGDEAGKTLATVSTKATVPSIARIVLASPGSFASVYARLCGFRADNDRDDGRWILERATLLSLRFGNASSN